MYNNTPLTETQADFAAEHHDLIFRFLNMKRLPEVDYYDVAVFGYISAVRSYLAREDLRRYAFSTIAYKRMHSYVARNLKAEMRRKSMTVSFDDQLEYDFCAESPEKMLIRSECTGKAGESMSPCQALILHLSTVGVNIGDLCAQAGIEQETVHGELTGLDVAAYELYEAIAA